MQRFHFTDPVNLALAIAKVEAARRGSSYVRNEDVLRGLLRAGEPVLQSFLQRLQVEPVQILATLDVFAPPARAIPVGSAELPLTDEVKLALVHATQEATVLRAAVLDSVHVFLGLLRGRAGAVVQTLSSLGVTLERARIAAPENITLKRIVPPAAPPAAPAAPKPWLGGAEWLLMILIGSVATGLLAGRALSRGDVLAAIVILLVGFVATRFTYHVLLIRGMLELKGRDR